MAASLGMTSLTSKTMEAESYFPTLQLSLHRAAGAKDSTKQTKAAEAAEKSGYFGETAKYVLPSLNPDAEKLYSSGRPKQLDKNAVLGLKEQMKLRFKPRRTGNVEFFKQLEISFANFEKIVEKHGQPSAASLRKQKAIIRDAETRLYKPDALDLERKEEKKFENKVKGAEKRKLMKSTQDDACMKLPPEIVEQQTSNRRLLRADSGVCSSKEGSIRGSRESLRQKNADSTLSVQRRLRHDKSLYSSKDNLQRSAKNSSRYSSRDQVPDQAAEIGREKYTLLETIAKVRSAVKRVTPILISASNSRRGSITMERAGRHIIQQRKRISRKNSDVVLPKPQLRKRRLIQKNDRRQTMANLPELELCQEQTVRFLRMGEARDFFKKYIRKILIILCWWQEFSTQYQTMENQMKTFFDMAQELDQETTRKHIAEATGLHFDPKDFKAKKEIKIAGDVRKILTLPPHSRNNDMVQKVVSGLQSLKSFAEYPIHMQEKLAKVAWYQEVSPRRVILRQGHSAENFYFILSGFAVVKIVMTKGKNVSLNVVARLSRGQSFGEIALLHHSKRTATVESGNNMAMLSIGRDDFLEIFFNMKNGQEPEHVVFCRQIPFLSHWPIEKIHENPGSCMFHFFRRGTIVVPNSQTNEWIYIVKTGSCRILKRLQAVDSVRVWATSHSQDQDLEMQYKYGAIIHEPKVDTGRRRTGRLEVMSPMGRTMTEFFTTKQDNVKGDFVNNSRSKTQSCLHGYTAGGEDKQLEREDSTRNSPSPTQDASPEQVDKKETTNQPGYSKSKVNGVVTHRRRGVTGPLPIIKRGCTSPERNRYVRTARPPHSTFIELRRLRQKDVFGLEDVQFDDEHYDGPQTSVMLVSDGSELILLSRKLFIQHANEFVRQYVREHVTFFPDNDVLQENLQTEVNWNLFRSEELVSTLMHIHDEKTNTASFKK